MAGSRDHDRRGTIRDFITPTTVPSVMAKPAANPTHLRVVTTWFSAQQSWRSGGTTGVFEHPMKRGVLGRLRVACNDHSSTSMRSQQKTTGHASARFELPSPGRSCQPEPENVIHLADHGRRIGTLETLEGGTTNPSFAGRPEPSSFLSSNQTNPNDEDDQHDRTCSD